MIDFTPPPASCRLGIVSDTHGLLRPPAIELLQGIDMIIHAGDVGSVEVLETLKSIAPVVAVRGNMDGGELGRALPATETVRIGAFFIRVLHDVNRLGPRPLPEEIDLVIHGHTHTPHLATVEGVMYLNPGSIGPRRFLLPITLAIVDLVDRQASVTHIDIDSYRRHG